MAIDLNKEIQTLREAAAIGTKYQWSKVTSENMRLANHLKKLLAEQQAEAAGKQGRLL